MRLALLWGTTVLVVLATTNADLLARPSTAMPMTSTPSAFAMAQKPRRVTLPAGTRILIRTIDSVDTKNQKTGARFTASLETSLKANGVVVARRGTTIYGRVASAKSAGKFKGSSQLSLELTDIVINGTPCPIVSSTLDMK
ncbi:MAG TPA: hypothetical protein VNS63_21180, partial [Blastocatellia bacterium]|nr:hypothetical protein [Blastocatellia bacterium]